MTARIQKSLSPDREFVSTDSRFPVLLLTLFLLLHIPLALAMHQTPMVATGHALLTVGFGLFLAVSSKKVERVVWTVAYIMGAEVLWRMCKAGLPWELGKYSVSLILLISGLRFMRRRPHWPFFYLALLLPGALVTFFDQEFSIARQLVGANLSGPVSLSVALWFFSGLAVQRKKLGSAFVAAVAPVLGVAAITAFTTYTREALQFTTESNFATSGGFGPNQVSATLALGFVLTFFLICLLPRQSLRFQVFLFCLLPVFLMQSAMTFSRTGTYLALGGALMGAIPLIRRPRARIALILGAGLFFILANNVILPRLDRFTGGMLVQRFSELSTTNRLDIFMEEMKIWEKNPVVGVGVGMAKFEREGFAGSASHTEYSRLFSEHGMFGFTALCVLIIFVVRNLFGKSTPFEMALALGLLVWFVGFLMGTAMRTVAPSVVLAITFARIVDDEYSEKSC